MPEQRNFQEYLESQGVTLDENTKASDAAKAIAGYVRESIGKKADVEAMKAIKGEIKEVFDKIDGLKGSLVEQGKKINDLSRQPTQAKTVAEAIKSQFVAQKEVLDRLKSGDKSAKLKFEIPLSIINKAPANMSLATNTTGQIPQAQRLAGIGEVKLRETRFLDVLPRGTATSNIIEWVYEANYDGTPAQTAEGAAKAQVDFDLTVGSERIEKTTAYIKITDEMLDDVDQMRSRVDNNLLRRLIRVVESGAFNGNGTTPNLRGIATVASTFAAGTFAATVDNANIVDVLAVAMDQIMIAEQPMPNYIFMYPSDITSLKLVKLSATDKRYIDRLQMVAGTLTMDGVPIIPTTLVPQDEFLIGDFNLATLYQKGGIMLEVGYDGNDFTTNFKTIRAEWRGACVVEHNDRAAFVTGDFTTAIAALETP